MCFSNFATKELSPKKAALNSSGRAAGEVGAASLPLFDPTNGLKPLISFLEQGSYPSLFATPLWKLL
jgi:hypothetical protein